MSRIALVLAMATGGVIGANGALPWRIAEDMKHFKAVTMGKPVAMGRKTWDSLPKKPLPGRANIVITRDRTFAAQGAMIAHSLDEALAMARGAEEIAIIGGAEIYKQALPVADIVHLTDVHGTFEGDVHMPPFDPAAWRETAREDRATADGLGYSFVTLERR
jgi:dihydrofolate reductase